MEQNILRREDWNEAKAFSISDFTCSFCNNTKGRKRTRKWVRGRWRERWSIKQSYFFTLWIYSPDRHLYSKLLIFYIQILQFSILGPRFVWTDYPLIPTMKLNYPFYVFRYFQSFPELFLGTEQLMGQWVKQVLCIPVGHTFLKAEALWPQVSLERFWALVHAICWDLLLLSFFFD